MASSRQRSRRRAIFVALCSGWVAILGVANLAFDLVGGLGWTIGSFAAAAAGFLCAHSIWQLANRS